MTDVRSILLPATDDAPALARRLVLEALGDGDERAAIVELLVSEMVTDALREAPTELSVSLELCDDRRLRFVVAVPAGEEAREPDRSDDLQRAISRRTVERLADAWESDLDRTRTSTWFELAS